MINKPKITNPKMFKTNKKEGAPILFFLDFTKTENYKHPVFPVPARIDKIINGLPSVFIFPKEDAYIQINDEYYYYNYSVLYKLVIENLISFAQKIFLERTYYPMHDEPIVAWWNSTVGRKAFISSYSEDLRNLLQFFLEAYKKYIETNQLKDALLFYCTQIIEYTEKRIDSNEIIISIKNENEISRMYRKKKKKYILPDIIGFECWNEVNQKQEKTGFVPILIYDDLLECFLFNKKELEEKEDLDIVNFESFLQLGIIEHSKEFTPRTIKQEEIIGNLDIQDFLNIF